MTKHLFRANLTDPRNDDEKELVEVSQSFKVSDEALSPYLEVHVLDIPISEVVKDEELIRCVLYGRNLISEWGNTLFVNPGLLIKYPFWKIYDYTRPHSMIFHTNFRRNMRKWGYKKRIVKDLQLSDEGQWVFGEKFILLSDRWESQAEGVKRALKHTKWDVPFYFVPSITSYIGGHTDCDYQIIDFLKIIYGSHNVFRGPTEKCEKARRTLEDIANRYKYEVREYKSGTVDMPMPDDLDRDGEAWEKYEIESTKVGNGINFITDGRRIFTSWIDAEEKEHLHRRGLEVIIIPLGKIAPGAGLRCVYGEFNV